MVAEHVFGRRHARQLGQVIHQRADELGPRGPCLHAFREVFVVRRNRFLSSRLSDSDRARQQQEQENRREPTGRTPPLEHDITPLLRVI